MRLRLQKNPVILFISLLLVGISYSQSEWKCATNEQLAKFPKPQSYSKEIQPKRGSKYIIPVVIHVLHLNGSENISEAQINNALGHLNADFNRKNSDTSQVVAAYKGKIANMNMEFRLATIDPQGNPTTGIERFETIYTDSGIINTPDVKLNQWPHDKYLNIWVCRNVGGGAAAYSWYPSYAQDFPTYDGIVTEARYFGTIGVANANGRHVMTHEVGHYYNLKHPFDDPVAGTDCGNDEVEDTPITKSSGCDLGLSSCNPPIIENVQNFMTGSYCFVMFTEGQRMRVDSTLNSNVGGRRNQWQQSNLIATGVYHSEAGLSELNLNQLHSWPNPVAEELNFQLTGIAPQKAQVSIVNITGVELFREMRDVNAFESNAIPVTTLSSGSYFLRVVVNEGVFESVLVK